MGLCKKECSGERVAMASREQGLTEQERIKELEAEITRLRALLQAKQLENDYLRHRDTMGIGLAGSQWRSNDGQ